MTKILELMNNYANNYANIIIIIEQNIDIIKTLKCVGRNEKQSKKVKC